jgi:hypothetical protein
MRQSIYPLAGSEGAHVAVQQVHAPTPSHPRRSAKQVSNARGGWDIAGFLRANADSLTPAMVNYYLVSAG